MEANFYSESELLAWLMILFLRTLLLLLRLCSTSFLRLEWLDSTGWVVNWLACSASGWDILLLRFLLLSSRPLVTESPSAKGKSQL